MTVFDPLGSDFTPKGKVGPRNGFNMKDGVFTLTFEQFKTLSTGITYEDVKTPAIDKRKNAKN